ncbi:MAG: hypothetical protein ABEK17_00085 [Candidatus Aenigmatarchaeota archaeon]
MKMEKISLGITTLLAIAAILAFPVTTDTAVGAEVNDTDDATVSIEVSSKTMVDISPESLAWTGVEPGSSGNNGGTFTAEGTQLGEGKVQIENIGSTNITKIWFNTTSPDSRPFGTGTNASYDSGNYIAIAEEGSSDFGFVNRVEFNETRELVYLTDPDGSTPPSSNWAYGRFRNTSKEYFWMLDNSDAACDGDNFYVATEAHTKSQTGKVDFSSGTNREDLSLSSGAAGYCESGTFNLGGGEQYRVVVDESTLGGTADPQVMLVKWNADLLSTPTQGDGYFYDGTLYPGNSTVAEVDAFVPQGVAQGYSEEGTLTVLVNTL